MDKQLFRWAQNMHFWFLGNLSDHEEVNNKFFKKWNWSKNWTFGHQWHLIQLLMLLHKA